LITKLIKFSLFCMLIVNSGTSLTVDKYVPYKVSAKRVQPLGDAAQ